MNCCCVAGVALEDSREEKTYGENFDSKGIDLCWAVAKLSVGDQGLG